MKAGKRVAVRWSKSRTDAELNKDNTRIVHTQTEAFVSFAISLTESRKGKQLKEDEWMIMETYLEAMGSRISV